MERERWHYVICVSGKKTLLRWMSGCNISKSKFSDTADAVS